MSMLVSLRHLEAHPVVLEGHLPVAELDIDVRDEIIRLGQPLQYRLEVQKFDGGLLVQGRLHLDLECECVRCLKTFRFALALDPWTTHLPLQGEDAVRVINDCVDLTSYVREDILLEFPQHPLCNSECRGLPMTSVGQDKNTNSGDARVGSSAWDELNKLKL
jgi:uncharacterized metal-binding protein YceD (DUF177 family)